MDQNRIEKLRTASLIVDLLESATDRDAIDILEIATKLLFTGCHCTLKVEPF